MPMYTLKYALLIEEDPATCEMMYMLFGRYGFALTTAQTLQEGLRWARWRRFDLFVIGDLPDIGSRNLCRQLRDVDAQTPILVYSSDAAKADRRRAMAAGAQAYLVKPDELNDLGPTMTRLVEEYEHRNRALHAKYGSAA
jgi:DNA-binding response OmpR family regulator